MRLLLTALLLMLISAGVTLALQEENGYFLLGYGVWTLEGSLVVLLLVLVIGFALLYALLRSLASLWQLPARIQTWHKRRLIRRARRALTQGLIQSAEGQWASAEKNLLRMAEHSETPLLHYLAGARAAQFQDAHERRDRYLQLAHQSMPSADIAVALTQAELQLGHRQLEQALATLSHLRTLAPRHHYVLKLLVSLYQELKDWPRLAELIPSLRQQKVFESQALFELERRVQLALMAQASQSPNPGSLRSFWAALSRSLQSDPQMLAAYVAYNQGRDNSSEMEGLIRDFLKNDWDETLVGLYAKLDVSEPHKLMAQAESWLQQRSRDPVLLLTLGRLALRGRLWGKARSYLEASLGLKETPEAWQELGALLEHLDDLNTARDCYRKGLGLAIERPETQRLPAGQSPLALSES
jgi:HemY protein